MATKATMPPRIPPICALDRDPLDRSGGGGSVVGAAAGGSAGLPSEYDVGGPLPSVTLVDSVVNNEPHELVDIVRLRLTHPKDLQAGCKALRLASEDRQRGAMNMQNAHMILPINTCDKWGH
ncbi:uncharacterized protein CCOS01_12642 [Colletotrichum costaricense]|uniref:Uncharacterized protein n=1 Tax=Colletotrichum costaricense TaxID=1209916 RepID=A0AAI9YNM1_9PEZI|nr:uncharacterized protein CCOS01_12642 [Colletotrichum costaricense]KAK1517093.1 hypothetical protein CCOS01_12642 [Colletotrichum costaricense]